MKHLMLDRLVAIGSLYLPRGRREKYDKAAMPYKEWLNALPDGDFLDLFIDIYLAPK